MGNSQTKEARIKKNNTSDQRGSGSDSPSGREDGSNSLDDSGRRPQRLPPPRRGSGRPDFSTILGMVGGGEPDVNSLEARRENKAEKEARRAEREKHERLKERERSMKEEHVDGGYLVTQGVYVGPEDYSKNVVRQLMIERRLAPFWRGLNDFSESWAEHQIMAAARGMEIPPADHVPPELEYTLARKDTPERLNTLVSPGSRSQLSTGLNQSSNAIPIMSSTSPPLSSSPSGPLFRARAKTLASLGSTRNTTDRDMLPREFKLPPDSFVNGQPIEVFLYKDAVECPICVLYYPRFLNMTRCCEQAICSECFVQIKRPDPHPPEHNDPDPNAPPLSEEERAAIAEGQLVSEVTACPYCKQPEFGITYIPPPFRRGLTYGTGSQPYQVMSAGSSENSLTLSSSPGGATRRRGTSLSVNAPEVVTTDKIRPDWAQKLATARAHAARRSAAASALHAAAYLINDGQRSSPFARRHGLRRSTLDTNDGPSDAQLSAMSFLAERHAALAERDRDSFFGASRAGGSRRSRMDDLEDMMMMEAIRLSLAAEEDRRKREEKEAKKKAKKEEKEQRKAEKSVRRQGNGSVELPFMGRENPVPVPSADDFDKGKSVERQEYFRGNVEELAPNSAGPASLSNNSEESLTVPAGIPFNNDGRKRSHLRNVSTVSSASSSFHERGSSTPPANEPMFNFRSLTAMVSEADGKDNNNEHVEYTEAQARDRVRGLSTTDDQQNKQATAVDENQSTLTGVKEGHRTDGI